MPKGGKPYGTGKGGGKKKRGDWEYLNVTTPPPATP
jgi:hypothetical protein